jgi:hypothetical protein
MLRLLSLLYLLFLSQASFSQQAERQRQTMRLAPVRLRSRIRPAFLFRPRPTRLTQARAFSGLERTGCGLDFPRTQRGEGWGTIRLATQPSDKSSSGGGKAMTGAQSHSQS